MGDPCGIGPEIILKTTCEPALRRSARLLIIGDADVMRKARAAAGSQAAINSVEDGTAGWKDGAINVLTPFRIPSERHRFGMPDAASGRAAVGYIEKAYGLLRSGIGDGMVTAPIHKAAAKAGGLKFPGHTEFLAHLCGARDFAMMLIGGPLKVTLVTRHVRLRDVSARLSIDEIAGAVKLTHDALERYFGVGRPRIGVAALNPHGGEGGAFGDEEERIIIPAVKLCRRRKMSAEGPVPADALFYDAYRGAYDAVVCLYHDQGLIPLKMIARDTGVNVTLGLDFIRTSPDHGTACDIAGRNLADPSSMIEAARLALRMAVRRNALKTRKRQ